MSAKVMKRPNGEIWLVSETGTAPAGPFVTGRRWVQTRKAWTKKPASFIAHDLADWTEVSNPDGGAR